MLWECATWALPMSRTNFGETQKLGGHFLLDGLSLFIYVNFIPCFCLSPLASLFSLSTLLSLSSSGIIPPATPQESWES